MKNDSHNIVKFYEHNRHYLNLRFPHMSIQKHLYALLLAANVPYWPKIFFFIFKISLGLNWIKISENELFSTQLDLISVLVRFILAALALTQICAMAYIQ